MELIDSIMTWVIAPVAAFVWLIYQRQNDHHTDIAVMKNQIASDKIVSDRERMEMKATVDSIFAKLNSIEEALRK